MKRYILTLIATCAGLLAMAQSETTSFDVDGIKVIYKPTQKNLINLRIYYRAGVSDYPLNKAGIESFAIEATTQCGTTKYTGDEFKDIADKYSILIGGSSVQDYGYIQLNCIPKYLNYGWDLFTEAVMKPAFNHDDVELLRSKMISRAKAIQSSPDERLEQLIMKNGFEGTPYETEPDGTEESLSKLTTDDLKDYYTNILNKNRVFIVVVGNIEKEDLINRIKGSFAGMPVKPYTPVIYQMQAFNDNKVLVEKRDIQTNYLGAIMNAPKFTDADFVPFRLGMGAFSGLLFRQLRTNLHLSYSQGAYVRPLQMPYAEMYISTTKPKEAAKTMTSLLQKVKEVTISETALKQIKSGFVTSNYMHQQSSASITASLGAAEILGGWQYEANLPSFIENTTVDGIKTSLNTHIIGLRWSFLGNQAQADDAADVFKQPMH